MKKKNLRLQKPEKKQRYDEEAAKLLPSSISGIKVQRRNTTRFSIYIEDRFLIGVSDSTLTRFNLRKGVSINFKVLDDILKEEDTWAIKEYCIRLLGKRDHARNELKDKARKKGYPSDIIENVLDELVEKGYINNTSFAVKFARDKFEFNKWGSNKIRAELFKKGVSEKDINTALAGLDEANQIEAIEELVEKNKRKFLRSEPAKRKKKIFDFLLRKGYSVSLITKQINYLLRSIEQ
ncbi:MAG: regulatory protein RecX [Balneola sp.]